MPSITSCSSRRCWFGSCTLFVVRDARGAALLLLLFWPFLIQSGVVWRAPETRRTPPPAWLEVLNRRGLVPALRPGPAVVRAGSLDGSGRRILHSPGDPDGLFTFGSAKDAGVRAVVEVSDVLPRVVAPEPGTGDDRPRATGDYQPIDAAGHPRQLRVAARITW
jgi:hypothetical protein